MNRMNDMKTLLLESFWHNHDHNFGLESTANPSRTVLRFIASLIQILIYEYKLCLKLNL